MSNNKCRFIPCRIYKNRVGEDFRFIAFVPDAEPDSRAIFLYLSNGGVTTRYTDGREMLGRSCIDDILLPIPDAPEVG